MYEYRFNENRIERWPTNSSSRIQHGFTTDSHGSGRWYPNSAESSSPPWGESAGSSPEYLLCTSSSSSRLRTTSPVSPKNYSTTGQVSSSRGSRRSALRQHGHKMSKSTKSVQWVSDTKKRPQDISSDRKVVKVQVQEKFK
jgi:hypothetical protein